jgi:hypothetical protein
VAWWSPVVRTRAQTWTYLELGSDTPQREILPESAYVSILLRSARIVDVRRGLRRFYGVAHATTRLPSRSGRQAEFSTVVAPPQLRDVEADRPEHFIVLSHRLLGPVPYVGGDLEAEVGLFSVASADLTAPYIGLLEAMSRQAGVAFVSVARPFVAPLVQGINLLSGASASTLEIGLANRWRPPHTGWIVALRAPREEGPTRPLSVAEDDFVLLDADGKPVLDYSYLVMEVVAERSRDDWFAIPELATAYGTIQSEYRRGPGEDFDAAVAAFRSSAMTCGDLLLDDALALVEQVDARLRQVGPPRPRTRDSNGAPDLPPLSSIPLFTFA